MKRGFTLLELIIVIIVIGILASIALPQYKKVVEKGRITEGITILSAMRSAQFRYYSMKGVYTNSSSDLDVEYSTPKYFDLVNPLARWGVAGVHRNTVDYPYGNPPPGYYNYYYLVISEDGNITCGGGGSQYVCPAIGMVYDPAI